MSKYTVHGPSGIPLAIWLSAVAAALLGRTRSASADGDAIWSSLPRSPRIVDAHHIPAHGPLIVCCNHYNGPGVWVGLPAALMIRALTLARSQSDIDTVGVSAYDNFRLLGIPIPRGLTAFVFARFYRVYQVIAMPNARAGAAPRAAAVRMVIGALKRGRVVILFPEGGNVRNFVMRPVSPGVGSLLLLAARLGATIIPAGIYRDAGGAYCMTFGVPLHLKKTTPEAVELQVGSAIAGLLPPALRGPHATAVHAGHQHCGESGG
ncbi:MAG TPA: 1-acyl-sn-glycerol-3-phosphate acyltransferase [Chloroflexota bacterium]|nr:1-acyl-sn-glycerol-3-phosphate acyltransferase [Chloroflexota bacterium]